MKRSSERHRSIASTSIALIVAALYGTTWDVPAAFAHAGPHGGSDTPPEPTGPSPFQLVAENLANPRDIVLHCGDIYVVEGGTGGAGPCVDSYNGDYHDCYGATGAVVRIANGTVERVLTGLPSIAGPNKGFAGGASHLVFRDKKPFLSVAHYGEPERRAIFEAADPRFGKLIRIKNAAGAWEIEANISAFEDANNPDGEPVLETNPTGLLAVGNEFLAVDSGANTVLRVRHNGVVSLRYVFPVRPFPAPPELGLPPGTTLPVQSVPHAIVEGPDGAAYVGEFTGFPMPKGGARILRFGANGAPTVYADGFTNIIDFDFDRAGNLYVLEMATNGLLSQDVTGAVIKVAVNGTRTVVASTGLAYPTALAVEDDGHILVANYGVSGRLAQIIRL
jgi:hypothetical protein